MNAALGRVTRGPAGPWRAHFTFHPRFSSRFKFQFGKKLTSHRAAWLVCKQWKKEQAIRCCTADVFLCQSVNQLYNNHKMTKLVLFSTACLFGSPVPSLDPEVATHLTEVAAFSHSFHVTVKQHSLPPSRSLALRSVGEWSEYCVQRASKVTGRGCVTL